MTQQQHDDYVLDIPYTWEFFDYQNPLLLSYLVNAQGIAGPQVQQAFTYCELGCGNGMTSNLLAASLPQGKFYAVDFNAEHINNAAALADQGNLRNIHFLQNSFAEVLQRDDMPMMDYITLHGVYSWVSHDIRQQIIDIIQTYLKPNGLVYVSYNPLPRWAEIIPMWRMMLEHTQNMPTDSMARAHEGLRYLTHLRDNGAQYFKSNPATGHFLDELLSRDIHFVAHEFCNNHLEPQYFADVAQTMQSIELDYCCNADFDNSNAFIPQALQQHIDHAQGKIAKESRRSMLSNEFFRRDIYINGNGSGTTQEETRLPLLGNWVIGSRYNDFQIARLYPLYKDDPALQAPIYEQVMQTAYQGHFSITELCTHTRLSGHTPTEILDAIHQLVAAEHLEVFARKAPATAITANAQYQLSQALNYHLLQTRLQEDGQCYLASEILGSGVNIGLIAGLCVLILTDTEVENPSERLRVLLKTCQQHWDIAQVSSDAQAQAETHWCEQQWQRFLQDWLPLLLRYGILETA